MLDMRRLQVQVRELCGSSLVFTLIPSSIPLSSEPQRLQLGLSNGRYVRHYPYRLSRRLRLRRFLRRTLRPHRWRCTLVYGTADSIRRCSTTPRYWPPLGWPCASHQHPPAYCRPQIQRRAYAIHFQHPTERHRPDQEHVVPSLARNEGDILRKLQALTTIEVALV